MTDIISRDGAIERMRKGEPCETFGGTEGWKPTFWADLDFQHAQFRIPPEPRREAREWLLRQGKVNYDALALPNPYADRHHWPIHVREVLPDEVWVRRRTKAEWEQKFADWTDHPDHKCQWPRDGWIAFARALGLLIEDNKP